MRTTRPGHLTAASASMQLVPERAPGREAPNGNSVSLEGEMVKSVEARQAHDMALAIYRATSDVVRASLGRR
jgi:flagellar basal-body rod protein FlgB